ncbi:acetoin dehydrogenase dihydrolipoyllysine-residue acetyltransferase subunit [Phyllobacterium brassicacearum]|uniref:Acetoin dehydrogenase dihydrolipoyllysine-residue acetyltransferase subunit n=1 Tax=Phyllobacterium brassicacearum TaxID=314235 RepID=A0A2P7B4P7_9HYPH|nr:acetoin dehydrogenase dihydrolipoyllysine-residue acetyltransferase subunit [Phyllobacterium brassicacearum]PSH61447.1 acetoin dehydrogenase dihydrolipoyllysine-residue acetyltransferase subunit [Phyllobacterium brassicacearum]TDQ35211.1 pyruvate dehydrogenase E2 component (dihydrolipoamide acetyltransferase) [Phyllobacterium brassicacearum]
MPVEVILPKVDMDMESGQISRWYAKDGDSVSKGQLLFEIETDKAAMEVDAPSSGILRDVTAQEGTTVPVGQAVAWIYADGEAYNAAAPAKTVVAQAVVVDETKPALEQVEPVPEKPTQVMTDGVRATPLARRIARDAGIDLASLKGSGPKGRIQKKDVEATIAKPIAPVRSSPPLHAVWLREGKDGRVPLVLIHGFGSDLNSWRPMLGGPTMGSPILAIDLPGHGGSTRSIPDDLDGIASLVEQTIAAYHAGPIILVGHSFGGAIAACVAARTTLDIRALALIAPAGLGPEINGAFLSGFVRARTEASLVAWMKQLVQDEGLLTKPFIKVTLAQSQDVALRDAQQIIADRFFADGTQTFDIRPSLGNLAIPVRVIFGAADRVIPAVHAGGLPGDVAVHVFAGTGHMPQLEQREKIMRILGEMIRSVA